MKTETRTAERRKSPPAFSDPSLPLVAGLSLAAAVLHGGVTGAHFAEWVGYGVFFLTAATLQFVWGGFLLVRVFEMRAAQHDPFSRLGESRLEFPFYGLGLAGNLAIALLYLMTRTFGIPLFGPGAGEIEGWDAFGLITTALEAATVMLLVSLIMRVRKTRSE